MSKYLNSYLDNNLDNDGNSTRHSNRRWIQWSHPKKYSLQIAGKTNLHEGIHKAVIFDNALELVLFKDNKIIHRVSLSPDRASFHRTLQNTKDKISLICKRLNISEEELDYQQTPLSAWKKIRYKSLILLKMIYTMCIPTQWIIAYKAIDEDQWHKIIPEFRHISS